jgi:hypothetical protein
MNGPFRVEFDFAELQQAFNEQTTVFVDLVSSTPDLTAPTALGDWDCAVLVGHVSAALEALWRWQGEPPETAVEVHATSWWDLVDPSLNTDFALRYAAKRSHQEIRDGLSLAATHALGVSAEASPDLPMVAPGATAWAKFDQVLATRVFELTVHGMDLAAATACKTPMAAPALEITGRILDNRTEGLRPLDIDSIAHWVSAATGRSPHPDPRLPAVT